jgi:2-methylcitrate dehydratase PrpD
VPYQLTLRLFERPALSDPRRGHRVESEPGAALRKKLHLKAEGGLSAFYPRFWPARCVLTTDDGSARVAEAMSQLGDPESPMDGSLLLAKWRDILAWVVPEEQGSLLLRHLERYLEGSLALAQIFAEAEQAMR